MFIRKNILYLFIFLPLFTLDIEAYAKDMQEEVIYFGVIPRYNPVIMYRSYQPMMDYLSANTDYRFELKLSRNYQQAVELLCEGKTRFASLGDVTFIEAHQEFNAVPILKPLNRNGEPFYHSIIIVPVDSPIKEVKDLAGKSFAFGDPSSTSGTLIPRTYLCEQGIHFPEMESVTHLESHDAVAKAVLKGNVDAGAVKDVVARRYQQHGLRFLVQSGPIPAVPIVTRRDTPAGLVNAVKAALLKIDPSDPHTQQMLQQWDGMRNFRMVLYPPNLIIMR
ncbi:MAG: phosphate/phosphite/phosphonate ABC transporter substrate-binding protein [Geobacteraceae bacterium]|nr:phosphate/phosphite/phosphonate ABC transporter substrate-binding protein [Geobacteraceae bacterium]